MSGAPTAPGAPADAGQTTRLPRQGGPSGRYDSDPDAYATRRSPSGLPGDYPAPGTGPQRGVDAQRGTGQQRGVNPQRGTAPQRGVDPQRGTGAQRGVGPQGGDYQKGDYQGGGGGLRGGGRPAGSGREGFVPGIAGGAAGARGARQDDYDERGDYDAHGDYGRGRGYGDDGPDDYRREGYGRDGYGRGDYDGHDYDQDDYDPDGFDGDSGGGGGLVPGGRAGKPKRKRRGKVAGGVALIIVLLILVPVAVGGIWAYNKINSHYNPPNYSGAGTGDVTMVIHTGDSATIIGDRLYNLGVIASVRAFVLAAEKSPKANSLEPGFYRMHKDMNATLAFNLLLSPASKIQNKVTLPEGLRVSEILAVLGQHSGVPVSDYNTALKNAAALGLPSYAKGNPEGYLFPDTYEIQPDVTATQVLQQMVQSFDQEATAVDLTQAAARVHMTPAEIITVASLAQAEGGTDADFPKIAEVIYNRLHIGMKLDLDSTVLFALNKYGIQATDAQLTTNSPYNTYKYTGLPPGPIDCPGAAAIQAALHPDTGNYIYFVTVNPRTKETLFTSSEAQFEQYQAELEHNLGQG
jgi:UPF0755 protein